MRPAGPTPSVYGSHHSSKSRTRRARSRRLRDLSKPGRGEELGQLCLARAGKPGFVDEVAVELAGGLPVDAQRRSAAGQIPDGRGDDALASRDARHLPQPGDRLGHEVDDELRERRVERVVRERQALGGRLLDRDARDAAPVRPPTNGSDGSTAVTRSGPTRATSSAVSAPGPQPTSITR